MKKYIILILLILISCIKSPNVEVAIIGDSLVNGGLVDELNKVFPDHYQFYNFGVDGERSSEIYARNSDETDFTNKKYFLGDFDILIYLIGMNDYSVLETLKNGSKIYQLAKKHDIKKVIYLGHWDFISYKHWTDQKSMNIWVADGMIAENMTGSADEYIALYNHVEEEFTSDGLHLNASGNEVVASVILNHFFYFGRTSYGN